MLSRVGSRGLRLVVVAITTALLAGCGTSVAQQPTEVSAPTLPEELPPSRTGVVLPSPPPGVVLDDPSPQDEAVDEVDEVDDGPVRVLAGYTGDRWAEQLDGEVRVLDDSVTVRDGVVRGLVRNGRSEPVGPVVVSAAGAATEVALPVLRPGEPAPFVLEVADDVPDDADGGPDVVVEATPAAGRPGRDLLLATFWERRPDDPRPVDTYLFTDPDTGPRPAVAFGDVRAADAVAGLLVVAAWVDEAGRVVAVDEAAELASVDLAPGDATDFLVAADGSADLAAARLVLWGSGS